MLAIEADGVMYHSSDTARDRDRLRQDHLERLGWRFHRIWSSEWFRHRDAEVARAVAAYEDALRDPDPDPEPASEPFVSEAYVEEDTPTRSGPKPVQGNRGPITEYSQRQLIALVRWIASDGLLRTKDEMIEVAMAELGFRRGGARIVAALTAAIDVGLPRRAPVAPTQGRVVGPRNDSTGAAGTTSANAAPGRPAGSAGGPRGLPARDGGGGVSRSGDGDCEGRSEVD